MMCVDTTSPPLTLLAASIPAATEACTSETSPLSFYYCGKAFSFNHSNCNWHRRTPQKLIVLELAVEILAGDAHFPKYRHI
jgi:hypothetical protein